MNNYFLLSFLIILFFSCDSQKSNENLIIGDKGYKYWMEINSEQEDSSFYFNYFDKNGRWLVFIIENGKFMKHETPNDVIRTEKWKMDNDSTIIIGESSVCYLRKLTQDSMVMYKDLYKKDFIYTAAPDSLIPLEYRKMQYGNMSD